MKSFAAHLPSSKMRTNFTEFPHDGLGDVYPGLPEAWAQLVGEVLRFPMFVVWQLLDGAVCLGLGAMFPLPAWKRG